MESIPTQQVLIDLVRDALAAPGADPSGVAAALNDHPELANLGAIGPNIGDYIPVGTPGGLGAANEYVNLWRLIYGIAEDGLAFDKGLFSIVNAMRTFLDEVTPVADAEDLNALADLKDDADALPALAQGLEQIIQQILQLVPAIGATISEGMKPRVNVTVGDPVTPEDYWTIRNFMHWREPGAFVSNLVAVAKSSGDDRCLAFAYGYVIGYVSKVTGSPFVNSIVNGPYRLHWWRHRWIGNYVAAWVHGFAQELDATGNRPTDPFDYSSWKNLCDAELHKRIELPGLDRKAVLEALWKGDPLPSVLPEGVGACFREAFRRTYGEPEPATAGSHIDEEALNAAYLLTYLQLWFQTARDALGCGLRDPGAPPSDCGDDPNPPSWADPTSGSSPTAPPVPSIESDPDVGQIVSGVILALLGLLGLFTGNIVAGSIVIKEGIDDIIEGAADINWGKLRCDIYWYRVYLSKGLQALHDILTLGGFTYPYARDLEPTSTEVSLLGFTLRYDSGPATTRGRVTDRYPAARWGGVISTWVQTPGGIELPGMIGYLDAEYPDWFLDSPANPLANGTVIGAPGPPSGNGKEHFGNAVANCLHVFKNLSEPLPDYNLDADRGIGWGTWRFAGGILQDPVQVEPHP